MTTLILEELDKLYGRYEYLQNLYYDMYIDVYISPIYANPGSGWDKLPPSQRGFTPSLAGSAKGTNDAVPNEYIKLYVDFKCVCRLLDKIKTLLQNPSDKHNVLLGFEEINILLSYKDIKKFFDKHDILYAIIDSNHEVAENALTTLGIFDPSV
jgi:hypothetical protein